MPKKQSHIVTINKDVESAGEKPSHITYTATSRQVSSHVKTKQKFSTKSEKILDLKEMETRKQLHFDEEKIYETKRK